MPGVEPNLWHAQVQTVRHMGLKRAEKMNPDKKRDKKWLILAIVAILLVCAGLCTVPFWGDILLWLLD